MNGSLLSTLSKAHPGGLPGTAAAIGALFADDAGAGSGSFADRLADLASSAVPLGPAMADGNAANPALANAQPASDGTPDNLAAWIADWLRKPAGAQTPADVVAAAAGLVPATPDAGTTGPSHRPSTGNPISATDPVLADPAAKGPGAGGLTAAGAVAAAGVIRAAHGSVASLPGCHAENSLAAPITPITPSDANAPVDKGAPIANSDISTFPTVPTANEGPEPAIAAADEQHTDDATTATVAIADSAAAAAAEPPVPSPAVPIAALQLPAVPAESSMKSAKSRDTGFATRPVQTPEGVADRAPTMQNSPGATAPTSAAPAGRGGSSAPMVSIDSTASAASSIPASTTETAPSDAVQTAAVPALVEDPIPDPIEKSGPPRASHNDPTAEPAASIATSVPGAPLPPVVPQPVVPAPRSASPSRSSAGKNHEPTTIGVSSPRADVITAQSSTAVEPGARRAPSAAAATDGPSLDHATRLLPARPDAQAAGAPAGDDQANSVARDHGPTGRLPVQSTTNAVDLTAVTRPDPVTATPTTPSASFTTMLEHAVGTAATPPQLSPAASSAAAGSPVEIRFGTSPLAADFREAVGVQVSLLAGDGVQEARLHLNPAEMGPISIRIALDGSRAQVDFQVDSAATRSILESGLPELASALREAGLTLTGGGVSEHSLGQSATSANNGRGDAPSQQRGEGQGQGPSRGRTTEPGGDPLQQPPTARPAQAGTGRVDLYA